MSERFVFSDDPALVDVERVHEYLSHASYWAGGIPRELVERSIGHSVCIGVYDTLVPRPGRGDRFAQIGFARIVTDHATYAYLCDVYVLDGYRGQGIGKRLMAEVMKHRSVAGTGRPGDPGVRRFMLMTRDAHGLYRRYGFEAMSHPDRAMQKVRPNAYTAPPAGGAAV